MRRQWIAATVVVLFAATLVARHFWKEREEASWASRAKAAVERAHPAWHASSTEPGILEVSYRGAAVKITLSNMRRNAGDDPERFDEQVLNAAESAAHVIDSRTSNPELDYAAARDKLSLVLVPREYARTQKMATIPFVGDVLEAYVVDGEHHQRYVHEDDVRRWGIAATALHDGAVTAVARRAAAETYTKLTPDDPTATGAYVAIDTTDGYAAARFAVPEVRERLGKTLGYPYFVGIPNRDFLVAWSSGYSFASRFAAKVREDFGRRSYPISPEVFRVDERGVSLPAPTDPGGPAD